MLKYSKKIYLVNTVTPGRITLKTQDGDVLMHRDEPKRFKPYELQLANTVMKNNQEDDGNDQEDLFEVF